MSETQPVYGVVKVGDDWAVDTSAIPEGAQTVGACGLTYDTSCIDKVELEGASEAQREYAEEAARSVLNLLTAGQVANCPVLLRPCRVVDCMESFDWSYDGVSWAPRLMEGRWINTLPCGCTSGCGHDSSPSALLLPDSAAEVLEVWVDGTLLDPSEYRLRGRLLIRVDGDWPQRQDMDRDHQSEPETFGVLYRPGLRLNFMGERALGALVREFLRACTGSKKCALPASVQTLSRQGVTYDVRRDGLADGVMGIREVDLYVSTINPNHLKQAPAVYVPGGLR